MKKIGLKEALEDDGIFLAFLAQEARSDEYRKLKEKAEKKAHPTGKMLYDYVLGWLDKKDAMKIRNHFSFCGTCADEVLRIMRIERDLEEESVAWVDPKGLIIWISSLWEPQWAGVPVTASEIPVQDQSFTMDDGQISISCYWRPKFGNNPAYLHLSWSARISRTARIWVRFADPETEKTYSEICLGTLPDGEENFTSDRLGFDPSIEKWAMFIIFREAE